MSVTVRDRNLWALERANEVRSLRADLKADLKERRTTLADVLENPPEWLSSMQVLDLLAAAPKFGRKRALTALSRAGVSPARTVGLLTERQRRVLRGLVAA